jgi:hypothetical protein
VRYHQAGRAGGKTYYSLLWLVVNPNAVMLTLTEERARGARKMLRERFHSHEDAFDRIMTLDQWKISHFRKNWDTEVIVDDLDDFLVETFGRLPALGTGRQRIFVSEVPDVSNDHMRAT